MRKKVWNLLIPLVAFSFLLGCGDMGPATTEKMTEEVNLESTGTESETETVSETESVPETSEEETEMTSQETTEEESTEDDIDANVKEISPAKKLYVQYKVNIRKGPGSSYERIGEFDVNDVIDAIGKSDDGWYKFMYNDEPAYAYAEYFGENEVDLEARAAKEAEEAAAKEAAKQAAQAAAANAPAVAVSAPAGVIMIGDSRCVQMRDATGGGGVSWVCENGKGYNWFMEKGLGRVDAMVGKGTKVVFCLGVNDPGNASNYVSLANQKAAEWAGRGAKTYFVSCNPVWANPYTTEEQVTAFNSTVSGGLSGVTWIDTHSQIAAGGYKMVDGLHYDTDANVRIFNMIIGSL